MPIYQLLLLIGTLLLLLGAQSPEKMYYENGVLHFEYNYVDGKPQGSAKEYYDTSELKAEMVYDKGKLKFKKEFLKNGKLESEIKYEADKTLETRLEYYNTGELFRERHLINGKLEGIEKEFYQNGKVKAERNYMDGKRHGNAKGYHINGNLQGDWEFENGIPIKATIFYSSGDKWLEHTDFDKEGKLNGVSKEYDKEGTLIAKRYYENDIMVNRKRIRGWFDRLF